MARLQPDKERYNLTREAITFCVEALPSVRTQLTNLLQFYLEGPCIHGASYLSRRDLSLPARFFWRALMAACVLGFILIGAMNSVTDSDWGGTVITVLSTKVDTRTLDFPSLTICPIASIRKSVALRYLEGRYLPNTSLSAQKEKVHDLLWGLQRLRYPFTYGTSFQNRSSYDFIFTVNVTDFMLKLPLHWNSLGNSQDIRNIIFKDSFVHFHKYVTVLPTCREVLGRCFFGEESFDCCSAFHLQETNFGFCYAFNSCQDITRKRGRCIPTKNKPEHFLPVYVTLNTLNSSELLSNAPEDRGYYVVATSAYDIPQPTSGYYVGEGEWQRIFIPVTVTQQIADDDVRNIPRAVRKCRFRSESTPVSPLSHYYTESSCMEACRLSHIGRMCGCLPYHFTVDPRSELARYPTCNFQTLECMDKSPMLSNMVRNGFFHEENRNYWKDSEITQGFRGSCDCPPACDFSLYDPALARSTSVPKSVRLTADTVLSIFLQNRGKGVLYRMRRDSTVAKNVGTWGNIASLFLGASVLSAVELLYILVAGFSIVARNMAGNRGRSKSRCC